MSEPSGETFVLWIDRVQGGNLVGSVEHIANSSRRSFNSVEELGRLLEQALKDVPSKFPAAKESP